MKRDINGKLRALDARRKGSAGSSDSSQWDYALDEAVVAKADSLEKSLESYVKRASNKPHTQWALGAMQAVDSRYTAICHEEANRVADQLKDGLRQRGIPVVFRLQGSVACDIHIRGFSDVDILVITDKFFRYSPTGIRAQRGELQRRVTYDTLASLMELRKASEEILQYAYPAAKVDVEKDKAIGLSGGSLRRKVDAVPANWLDTDRYQETANEADRGVEILDKSVPTRIENLPFRHIENIVSGDRETLGGLKKAIRLCKSIKADIEEEGGEIKLTSYDIASFMWHANRDALRVGVTSELAILAESTRFIGALLQNRDWARTLDTPNATTKIFNDERKFDGLELLSDAISELAVNVAMENPLSLLAGNHNLSQALEGLKKAYVPE